MSEKLKELYEEQSKIVHEMRAMFDKADEEKRDLTSEEREKYDKMDGDLVKIEERIEQEEKLAKREKGLETSANEPIKPDPDNPSGQRVVSYRATEEYREQFNNYLRGDMSAQEIRALQADLDASGGYIVAPEQFVNELIKEIDNSVFMRQVSRVFQVENAESLGVPSLDADPADPTWTAEIKVGSEDSTMSFGKRQLYPHPLAQYIKVSKKLLRSAIMDPETLVRERLSYKIAVVTENAYLNGSGSNQPLGVFTASDSGISTSRDVSTGNTTTEITADNLINNLYNLKEGYQINARWIFHRDAVKMIRKLKDGNGQYLWQAGIAGDKPNTILDKPYIMSEYAPNTFTTGLYVGIIGDFNYYWIADALNTEIQVLLEKYADTNQNGYIIRYEGDGMPVLESAFSRVTLA